jgi:DNA-binding response OmpR family regulator
VKPRNSTLASRSDGHLNYTPIANDFPPPERTLPVQYLRVYVGQLRQKLGPAGSLIATEPGVGYRLADEIGEA